MKRLAAPIRILFALALAGLAANGLALFLFADDPDLRLRAYRMHNEGGKLAFGLYLLYLYTSTHQRYARRFAVMVAIVPIFVIWSLLAPTPLILAFFFDATALPLFIGHVLFVRTRKDLRRDTVFWLLFLYASSCLILSGLYSILSPADLRFAFFHRRVHGIIAAPAAAYLAWYGLFVLRHALPGRTTRRLSSPRGIAASLGIFLIVSVALHLGLRIHRDRSLSGHREAATFSSPTLRAHEAIREDPIPVEALNGSLECRTCHPLAYDQWAVSVHAYATRNVVFQKIARSLADRHGIEYVRLCATCHEPAVAFSNDPGLLLDPEYIAKSEGVSCRSCHFMSEVGDKNGHYRITRPRSDTQFHTIEDRNRYLMTATLEHIGDMTRDVQRDGTSCFPCHSLRSRRGGKTFVPVDNVTGFLESSASEFFRCHDCHMPRLERDEYRYSWPDHRMFGAQTMLDLVAIEPDDEQRKALARFSDLSRLWLEGRVPVLPFIEPFMDKTFKTYRLFNYGSAYEHLVRMNRMLTGGPHFRIDLERATLSTTDDPRTIDLEFSLATIDISHEFPSALFANITEVWPEIEVRDASGEIVASTGRPAELEEMLGRFEVDVTGRPIDPPESLDYVDIVGKRFITGDDPLTDLRKVTVPETLRWPVEITYRIQYQRYVNSILEWATDGAVGPLDPITLASESFVWDGESTTIRPGLTRPPEPDQADSPLPLPTIPEPSAGSHGA